MTLTELPYFFDTATRKVARRSPKPINIENIVQRGREEKDSLSRSFYVTSQSFAYRHAGFVFIISTVLISLAFREAAQIPALFLWGLGVGFTGLSLLLDFKTLKFQLLFPHKPTEQQLLAALHKLPGNWTWIIISVIAAAVPIAFFALIGAFA